MRRILLAAAVMLCACSAEQSAPTSPELSVLPAELRGAPSSRVVAGQTLVIDAYTYRDFFPVAPPDGRPLSVGVRVHARDGQPLTAALRADSIWVIMGAQVWTTRADPVVDRGDPGLFVVGGDGPKWGPDVAVDVVVRLFDGAGKAFYLRAAKQNIVRTM